jgi:hypothetical protein
VATAFIVTYLYVLTGVWDYNAAWVIPIMILGKVYSNAMMVNLNQRMQFSGGRNVTQTGVEPNIISGPLFQVPEPAVGTDVEIYEMR